MSRVPTFAMFAFWKKKAKINTCEKKRARKLNWRNLIPYYKINNTSIIKVVSHRLLGNSLELRLRLPSLKFLKTFLSGLDFV